jgi:hypothetical protein
MSNFEAMKRSRQDAFSKLTQQLEQLNTKSGGREDDGLFWKPSVDKAGNGFAVIRFLPAPEGEEVPFVRMFDHGFQGPSGQWYIENSLTTLGEKDPVSEYNSTLWNSTTDDNHPNRKQARDQKRRLSYISNIYVVKDPSNPDNEGKVFLYKYGKKIWDKIQSAMYPEFEGDVGLNPFDLWEGANFRLKIRQVEGYRNYDLSQFDVQSAVLSDDNQLEAIWKSEHSLQKLIDRSNFKTYEELEARLNLVLGSTKQIAAAAEQEEEVAAYVPKSKAAAEPQLSTAKEDDLLSTDDDDMSYFENLANS